MSDSKDPAAPSDAVDAPAHEAEPSAAAPSAAEPAAAPEEQAAPSEGAAPVKKKKKKRKKVEEAPGPSVFERPELDAEGNERPRFLLRFPQDPNLEVLIGAFEAGDFARVRAEAPRLVERADRPEVKRAAEELLRRIEPDPLVKFLLGVAVFLFVAVVAYVYYAHG